MWNTGQWSNDRGIEEESALTGRLGRFNRKFEDLGHDIGNTEWMDSVVEAGAQPAGTLWKDAPLKTEKKKKGGK